LLPVNLPDFSQEFLVSGTDVNYQNWLSIFPGLNDKITTLRNKIFQLVFFSGERPTELELAELVDLTKETIGWFFTGLMSQPQG
jgi:hypothetical protein